MGKDKHFNPYLRPASEALTKLVNIIQFSLEVHSRQTRQRARKRTAEANYRQQLEAIVANLVHCSLSKGYQRIAISRSAKDYVKSRYLPEGMTKAIPKLLDGLLKAGWITQELGQWKSHRTTICPSRQLEVRLRHKGISFTDLKTIGKPETIILTTHDTEKERQQGQSQPKKLKDYIETDLTLNLRSEMTTINQHLQSFEVSLSGPQDYDMSNRILVRRFNDQYLGRDFQGGGRLWGGVWQYMSKEDRRSRLFIDGQAIAEVDYRQMMPCLMYILKGLPLPEGDLYNINGYDRTGIKAIFNAMTFKDELLWFPKDTKEYFEPEVSINDVTKAIKDKHKPIRSLFRSGIGHRLQCLESSILVEVLLSLADEGVPCLPIHDALLCCVNDTGIVQQTMRQVALDHTGYELGVTITNNNNT
ncbi:hypothetical protein [Terasakiella pusilla]|uniref:hypothetical protein n=1 Tax=Terasakiella pusilla TaxID=64973 RepID=UPI003AA9657B